MFAMEPIPRSRQPSRRAAKDRASIANFQGVAVTTKTHSCNCGKSSHRYKTPQDISEVIKYKTLELGPTVHLTDFFFTDLARIKVYYHVNLTKRKSASL